MIEQGIVFIQTIISEYGAWGVFVATLVEEIVAPIPSAVVPLAAGFFLLPADASFALVAAEALPLVALPVALGIGAGSMAVYALAYYGGKPVIERYKRVLGVSWRDIERIEARMTRGRRDEAFLFILRVIPIIPGVAVSGFCGVVRYPFGRFMAITLIASGLRAFVLALLGWQAGEFYLRYLEVIEEFEKYIFGGIIALVVILGIVYYVWAKGRKHDDD